MDEKEYQELQWLRAEMAKYHQEGIMKPEWQALTLEELDKKVIRNYLALIERRRTDRN